MLPPLLQIGDCLVSTDIISECFACDWTACRGACCIIGESGAPMNVLKDAGAVYAVADEEKVLRDSYHIYSGLMTPKGRAAVASQGFSAVDRDGDMVTPLVADGQECAFCHFTPDGACMCAVQKAALDNAAALGGTVVAKPISCSLYPIRVRRLASGLLALNLHRWDICECAFAKGRKEGVRAYEFLKDPIVEAFGADFWEALDAARHQFCE